MCLFEESFRKKRLGQHMLLYSCGRPMNIEAENTKNNYPAIQKNTIFLYADKNALFSSGLAKYKYKCHKKGFSFRNEVTFIGDLPIDIEKKQKQDSSRQAIYPPIITCCSLGSFLYTEDFSKSTKKPCLHFGAYMFRVLNALIIFAV